MRAVEVVVDPEELALLVDDPTPRGTSSSPRNWPRTSFLQGKCHRLCSSDSGTAQRWWGRARDHWGATGIRPRVPAHRSSASSRCTGRGNGIITLNQPRNAPRGRRGSRRRRHGWARGSRRGPHRTAALTNAPVKNTARPIEMPLKYGSAPTWGLPGPLHGVDEDQKPMKQVPKRTASDRSSCRPLAHGHQRRRCRLGAESRDPRGHHDAATMHARGVGGMMVNSADGLAPSAKYSAHTMNDAQIGRA